jgi:CBS domain-containing protein
MKPLNFRLAHRRKRAVVDTVRSILDSKGYGVTTVSPGATVYEAIATMAQIGVGALPVVADGGLVGIVSERDYARKVILQGRSSRETLVREIMTESVVTVSPVHTVDECMRLVSSRQIRHLPVVEAGSLIGIISILDLVKAIISTQAFTIDQLHTYIATGYPS